MSVKEKINVMLDAGIVLGGIVVTTMLFCYVTFDRRDELKLDRPSDIDNISAEEVNVNEGLEDVECTN